MYAKNKGGTSVSSDAQAREKLALYVYEYLLHVGAQKAAQTFLSEIRWEKNISLGESPGFLHSWWCVFWDLYCAAPERCDTTEHSNEAKAFHEYGFVNGGYGPNPGPGGPGGPGGPPGPGGPNPPIQGMGPPTEGIPCNGPGSVPPGFYPNNAAPMRPTQPSQPPQPPHQQIIPSQYNMGPRYPPGPRPGPRMPMGPEYGGHPGHPMMQNGVDPASRQIPGSMGQMNRRMNAPMGPMGPRGPPGSGPGPGVPFIGMIPPGVGRPQWQPNTSAPMNNGYPSASPGNYAGAPAPHSGPGTPTMPSPQEVGSNHGADNLYGMVKQEVQRGNGGPGGPGEYGMSGRTQTDGGGSQIRGMGQNAMGSVLNNDSLANSPASGPTTPRDVGNGAMNDFSLGAFGGQGENGQMESAAILKIKESMQEEAKRFEKDSEPSDFFMR